MFIWLQGCRHHSSCFVSTIIHPNNPGKQALWYSHLEVRNWGTERLNDLCKLPQWGNDWAETQSEESGSKLHVPDQHPLPPSCCPVVTSRYHLKHRMEKPKCKVPTLVKWCVCSRITEEYCLFIFTVWHGICFGCVNEFSGCNFYLEEENDFSDYLPCIRFQARILTYVITFHYPNNLVKQVLGNPLVL